ncbi:MAG: hypothetical protein KGK16_10850, partial [Bradyrhizobium sp.]|nr:hypothetical protein [Bradyrhizobium sp.]
TAPSGGLINVTVGPTAIITGSGQFVGGIAGFNSSGNGNAALVINAEFFGSVSGPFAVGGLVGYNGGNINGGCACGTVNGISDVGGIAGFNSGAVYNTNSAAKVTGSDPTTTSDTIGQNDNRDPNAVVTPNGAVSRPTSPGQAAAAQQAVSAANVTGANTQTSALTPPTSALSAAGTKAVDGLVPPAMDNNFKGIESNINAEEQQQRRRLATTTAVTHHTVHRGGNLGATIRTIDVNGKRFNLQNGAPKPEAPAQPPQ